MKAIESNQNTIICFETGCRHRIAVSNREYNIITGKYLPLCEYCDENRPEFSLWDVEAIEEDSSGLGIEEHPLPSNKEYTVIDGNDMICEMFDKCTPNSVHPEIFIRNPNNSELLHKARKEASQMVK